jgi:GT2 family glycosyltransferase
VLVVDDASPGGAVAAVAAAFAAVRVLRLPGQRGFCAAANAGIATARTPVVELLNDDTEVEPGWAEAALARFAGKDGYTIPGVSLVGVGHHIGMSSPCSDSGLGPK